MVAERHRSSRRRIAQARELILLSAAVEARRRTERKRGLQLSESLDWDALAEQLRMRRLLGTLGPRIHELSEERGGPRFAAVVEEAIRQGRRQSALLDAVTAQVGTALSAGGIRWSTLKGPALSRAIYGDAGRRLSGDVDLLLPAEHLIDGVEIVRELGYGGAHDLAAEDGLPLLHFAMPHELGALPAVELHWRVHWYEREFARDRLLRPSGAGENWRASAADELTAMLLFYARDGFLDLRLASDLGAWWDVRSPELAPGALTQTLTSYPAIARAARSAALVAERLIGVPTGEALAGASKAGVRVRTAARLADPHPRRSRAQLFAEMGLIDGLLTPPGDMPGFLSRQLLLSPEMLAELDRQAPKRRRRRRVSRCLGVLGRYLLAFRRLLRTPERLSDADSSCDEPRRRTRPTATPLLLRASPETSGLPNVSGAQINLSKDRSAE